MFTSTTACYQGSPRTSHPSTLPYGSRFALEQEEHLCSQTTGKNPQGMHAHMNVHGADLFVCWFLLSVFLFAHALFTCTGCKVWWEHLIHNSFQMGVFCSFWTSQSIWKILSREHDHTLNLIIWSCASLLHLTRPPSRWSSCERSGNNWNVTSTSTFFWLWFLQDSMLHHC